MTPDTEYKMRMEARERAISRLSKSHANLMARPIRSGELDDTDMVGRMKFDAWAALKGKDADEAMQEYIDLIESLK